MPTGESQYHALELVLERRFSRGLQARFGYTYSHLNNNGAESAQGMEGINAGVQDPSHPLRPRPPAPPVGAEPPAAREKVRRRSAQGRQRASGWSPSSRRSPTSPWTTPSC